MSLEDRGGGGGVVAIDEDLTDLLLTSNGMTGGFR